MPAAVHNPNHDDVDAKMFEDELAADVAANEGNFYADDAGVDCQGSVGFNIISSSCNPAMNMAVVADPHSLMMSELFPSQTPHNVMARQANSTVVDAGGGSGGRHNDMNEP